MKPCCLIGNQIYFVVSKIVISWACKLEVMRFENIGSVFFGI